MSTTSLINKTYATQKLSAGYPHVGVFDVKSRELWIAKNKWGQHPGRVSHARLITGGSNTTGVADKDRFLCYWYHMPNPKNTHFHGTTGVHGYPIEWNEAHLLIRQDPNWDLIQQALIKSTDTRRINKNIDQQYAWAEHIFTKYRQLERNDPLSWHFIGPRATDSMFYVERVE
ncbi:MAG: hypothetical protein AAGC44_15150 [Planctomycetota bacterium]